MANVYVRSGAAGAGTGADWANAYTTLAAALTAKAAGDDFWVSEDHAETQASAMTLTSPGTASSPCRIICVNHAGSVPPVSADLRTTATISTTGANNMTFAAGHAYIYGIAFQAGSGVSTANININGTPAWAFMLQACSLVLNNTSTSSLISVGANNPSAERIELVNTILSFGSTGQSLKIRSGIMVWSATASAIGGTVPTTIFSGVAGAAGAGQIEIFGVDLAAAGSGKNLIDASISTVMTVTMTDCKLGASVSITTGSIAGPGGARVHVVNCDSSNTNYRYYRQNYQATETQETTIVRSGGASDGTTTVSRKVATTANSKFYSPYRSDWIEYWSDTTGSHTVTVPIVNDGTTYKDNDVWLEVEYQGTSSFPLGVFASDAAADVLNAGTNQTTDGTSTWTTTGLASPVKQTLDVTITTTGKGIIRARVCVAKATTTLYYDPLLQVS